MNLAPDELAAFLRGELENLRRIVELAEARIASTKKHPDEAEAYIESAAMHLQSFYTAAEQILSRIAENANGSMPAGGAWHVDLLRQMTYEKPGRRPPILRTETHDLLDELRGFRHGVRSVYTFRLNPERVQSLVGDLPRTLNLLSEDLEKFLGLLDALANKGG